MYSYRLEDNTLPNISKLESDQNFSYIERGEEGTEDWRLHGRRLLIGPKAIPPFDAKRKNDDAYITARNQMLDTWVQPDDRILFNDILENKNITFNGCRIDPESLRGEDGWKKFKAFQLLEFGDPLVVSRHYTKSVTQLLKTQIDMHFNGHQCTLITPEPKLDFHGSVGDIGLHVRIKQSKFSPFTLINKNRPQESLVDAPFALKSFAANYEEDYTTYYRSLELLVEAGIFPNIHSARKGVEANYPRGDFWQQSSTEKGRPNPNRLGFSLVKRGTNSAIINEILHAKKFKNLQGSLGWNSRYYRESFNDRQAVGLDSIGRGVFWPSSYNPLNALILFTEFLPRLIMDSSINIGQISPAAAGLMSLLYYPLWLYHFTAMPITSPASVVRNDFSILPDKAHESGITFLTDGLPVEILVFGARMLLLSAALSWLTDTDLLTLFIGVSTYTLSMTAWGAHAEASDEFYRSRPTVSRANICGIEVIEEQKSTLLGAPFYLLGELTNCLSYKTREEIAESGGESSWHWSIVIVSMMVRVPMHYLHPRIASPPALFPTHERQKISTHLRGARRLKLEAENLRRNGDTPGAESLLHESRREVERSGNLALSQSFLAMSAIFVFAVLPRFIYRLVTEGDGSFLGIAQNYLLPIPALAYLAVFYQKMIYDREECNLGPEVDYAAIPNTFFKTNNVNLDAKENPPEKKNIAFNVRAKTFMAGSHNKSVKFYNSLKALRSEKDTERKAGIIKKIEADVFASTKAYLARQSEEKTQEMDFEHGDGWRLVRHFKELLYHQAHYKDQFNCFPDPAAGNNLGRCYRKAVKNVERVLAQEGEVAVSSYRS